MNSTLKRSLVGITFAIAGGLLLRSHIRTKRRIELDGRVIVLTGASSGHGLILAKQAAREHAKIVIAARSSDDLEAVKKELVELGAGVVLAIPTDIRELSQVQHLVERTLSEFGKIDILINNAGIMTVGPVESMTVDDFQDHLATNFLGAMYATLEVIPHMKSRNFGRIVNIVSVGGKRAVPHMLPYTASKFALAGFTQGLQAELAKDGIFVTGVYPKPMRTGGHTHVLVRGNKTKEYGMFGLLANTPLVSSSPHSVARAVLEAVKNGDPELVIGWSTKCFLAAQSLLPTLFAEATALGTRLLPEDPGDGSASRGEDLKGVVPRALNALVPTETRPQPDSGF